MNDFDNMRMICVCVCVCLIRIRVIKSGENPDELKQKRKKRD